MIDYPGWLPNKKTLFVLLAVHILIFGISTRYRWAALVIFSFEFKNILWRERLKYLSVIEYLNIIEKVMPTVTDYILRPLIYIQVNKPVIFDNLSVITYKIQYTKSMKISTWLLT